MIEILMFYVFKSDDWVNVSDKMSDFSLCKEVIIKMIYYILL